MERDEAGAVIGREEVRRAAETLRQYKEGKAALERRIVANEEWWKMRHWQQMQGGARDAVEPVSAWLFNTLLNKHADAMDNLPEPIVLPRAEDDRQAAKELGQILPVVLEQCGYEKVWSDMWWYKLKAGTGAQGVFWDADACGGLGDVAIRRVDLLQLFWEPGVSCLEDSPNLFYTTLEDTEALRVRYPELKLRGGETPAVDVARYRYDDRVDTSGKTVVVDWYYRKCVDGRSVLHYCRFVDDEVLFASENEPETAAAGWYAHGQYPFVLDPLFPVEGSPAGFGYIDVLKDCQTYIDRLNQALLRNALLAGKTRYFIRQDGAVSEGEFANWQNDFVHVAGNLSDDSIREIRVEPLSGLYESLLQDKIDEMKETSGVRDFTQGGVTGGVTAGTAIAALQEAGSKLSRDMIKSGYRAYTRVCELCIELIRQFYDAPRSFRILGEGGDRFVWFDGQVLQPRSQTAVFGTELGEAVPILDVRVRPQKASPYSRIAQNELAKELFGMGLFRPEMADQALCCVDMMDFEGKDAVMIKIAENGGLMRQVSEMKQQMGQLAQVVDGLTGSSIARGIAAEVAEGSPAPKETAGGDKTQSDASAEHAQSAATPK